MTATIKSPDGESGICRRQVRFSSLETFGFTDVSSTWSDTPTPPGSTIRGRHLTRAAEAATVTDRQPSDFGRRLERSNIRWSMVVMVLVAVGAVAAFGYWIYQRPAAIENAAVSDFSNEALALNSALPSLTQFNEALLDNEAANDSASLQDVETAARSLFDVSGRLAKIDLRSLGSQAAGSALEGTRLAREAHAYRSAVLPMLTSPALETDREMIALDEAARVFGSWQRDFDEMRTVLPTGVFPQVTEQLDVLSADLTSYLHDYVDALRDGNQTTARNGLAPLGSRLNEIDKTLSESMVDIQAQIRVRVDETSTDLNQLISG